MKKVTMSLAIVLMCSMILGGCSMPSFNFGKKDDEITPPPSTQETNMYDGLIYVIGSEEQELDATVLLTDMVYIDETISGSVLNYGFIAQDGTFSETLPTSEEGEFVTTAMVEMADGTGWSQEIMYHVGMGSGGELPEKLKNNIVGLGWDILDIESESGDVRSSVSYVDSKIAVRANAMNVMIDEPTWAVSILTYDEENALADEGLSPLRSSLAKLTINSMAGMAAEEESEKYEWLLQACDNYLFVSTRETEYKLYGTDGTEYPIKEAYVSFNESVNIAPQVFYVDYGNDARILMTYSSDLSLNYWEAANLKDSDGNAVTVNSYEDVRDHLLNNTAEDYFYNPTKVDGIYRDLEKMTEYFVIGDVTTLQNGDNPSSGNEEAGDDGEEPDDNDDGEEGVKKEGRYASLFAWVFSWPKNANGDVYSRWIYEIDSSTSFVASIFWSKTGNYIYSNDSDYFGEGEGGRVEINPGSGGDEESGGSSGGSGSGGIDQTKTNGTLSFGMNMYGFDVEKAGVRRDPNSGTTKCTLYDDTYHYYWTTATDIEVNNLLELLLYSELADYDYEVVEDTVKSKSTALGSIKAYSVNYTDISGQQQHKGYLAVYRIGSDTMVLYTDKLIDDVKTFVDMLAECVFAV